MRIFEPHTSYEKLLFALREWPGFVGRAAGRKIARRCRKASVANFMKQVETLRPGMVALDIGANVGKYTCILAETGAEVHAFEPDPETFQTLRENAGHYPNVTLHQKAVGATSGVVKLLREKGYEDDRAHHSLGSSVVRKDASMDHSFAIDVDMISFDDAIAIATSAPKVIKMDIEGAEFDILDDLFARSKIDGFDALFVETHEALNPAKIPHVARLRNLAFGLPTPMINLYWP